MTYGKFPEDSDISSLGLVLPPCNECHQLLQLSRGRVKIDECSELLPETWPVDHISFKVRKVHLRQLDCVICLAPFSVRVLSLFLSCFMSAFLTRCLHRKQIFHNL